MNIQELQLAWDTLLIQSWRKAWSVGELIESFEQQYKVQIAECEILRKPVGFIPYKMGVRVFIANRLEKIGNRMWDQPVERDVALIAKLQTSKYTTSEGNTLGNDNDLQTEQRRTRKNTAKVVLNHKNYANRNQKTDWNVTK